MRDKWIELKKFLINSKDEANQNLTYDFQSDLYYFANKMRIIQIEEILEQMIYIEERCDV